VKRSELRSDPDKVQAWRDRSRERAVERARNAQREAKALLAGRRVPKNRREDRWLPGATGWTQRVFALYGRRCIVCGARAVQGHHVVPRQAILTARHLSEDERRQLAYDARQGVPVCARCHERHETAAERIPFDRLPGTVVEWAVEHGFRQRVFDRRIYTRPRSAP
jgi:hypothetical protein